MALLALLLLVAVPVAAWRIARSRAPRHKWCITGAAFGLVVSPLSLGLYSTYFAGLLPIGLVGLPSVLFHGAPGYHAAIWLGLVSSHEIVSGLGHVYVEVLNGVFWAAAYGVLGVLIDWARSQPTSKVA